MPQFDPATFAPQLIWLAITFVGLYLLMSRFALPRVETVVEDRARRIADDLDAAETNNSRATQALKAYETSLAEARASAHEIATRNRDRVKAELDEHRDALEARLNARIADAEGRIEAASTQAMASVGEIAGDTASAVVAHLIGVTPEGPSVATALEAELASAAPSERA
ncbi:MAG: hypothetical protein ACE5EM_04485 [Sphingomonadales bacterium]